MSTIEFNTLLLPTYNNGVDEFEFRISMANKLLGSVFGT